MHRSAKAYEIFLVFLTIVTLWLQLPSPTIFLEGRQQQQALRDRPDILDTMNALDASRATVR